MKFRIILLILFLFSAVKAQNPQTSPNLPVADGICNPFSLVKLDVSVWSSKIGYLKDLTHKDFEISEGKEKHKIDFFLFENKPASIGVLFDLSSSMKSQNNLNKSSIVAEAFKNFLTESHSENEYSLITFGKETSVLLETSQNQEEIRKALDKIKILDLKAQRTLLYDGISFSYEKILKGKHTKKVLIVVTDGVDTQSKKTLEEIKKISRMEDIQLYLIDVISQDVALDLESFLSFKSIPVIKREEKDFNLIKNNARSYFISNPLIEIASDTGGRLFYPTDTKETIEVFQEIIEEIKSQYLLGFYPKFSQKDWKKLEIKLNLPKEKKDKLGKVIIRTKKGYYSK